MARALLYSAWDKGCCSTLLRRAPGDQVNQITRTSLRLTVLGCCVASVFAATPSWAEPSADVRGLQVGAQMEDFGLRALDPQTGELTEFVWLSNFVGPHVADVAARKRLLLLNFFATWCEPCLRELPQLSQLQRSYGAKGLQVVSVNVRAPQERFEDARASVRAQLPAAGLGYPLLFDRFTNRNQLVYMGDKAVLPCSVLIDTDGKVVARFQGGRDGHVEALEARVRRGLGLEPASAAASSVEERVK